MSNEDTIVNFTGIVESVEKELIPKLYIGRIRSDDDEYLVEMDLHKDLKVYEPGTRVEVTISKSTPGYQDGVDLVARGTVVSTRSEGGYTAYLVSIGGLLFVLRSKKKLDLAPTEKLYIKISEV